MRSFTLLRVGLGMFTGFVSVAAIAFAGQSAAEAVSSLPARPSRQEIQAVRLFERPLTAFGDSTADENAALAAALKRYGAQGNPSDYGAIEQFLADHSTSAYAPTLRLELARSYYHQGRYSRALAMYHSAWNQAKSAQSGDQWAVAMQAVAGYAKMLSRVGRMTDLEQLLNAPDARRPMYGQAAELLDQTRTALWVMRHKPGVSFRCGSLALVNVSLVSHAPPGVKNALLQARSTATGFSLADLEAMTEEARWPQKAIQIDSNASIPVPSVVNWRIGHYAAILARQGGRYVVRDPTFGEQRDIVLEESAIREESSGYYVVAADRQLEPGWHEVAPAVKASIFGRGMTFGHNPDATRLDDIAAPECGSGVGMAVASVRAALVSLVVRDTPLFYNVPVGPAMDFSVTYNQRENNAFTDGFTNFGPRWSFNWLGWVNEVSGGATGVPFTVALPSGGAVSYESIAVPAGYPTGVEYFRSGYDSSLAVRTAPGNYKIIYPDGTVHEYTHPVGVASERQVLLTKITDPTGQSVTLAYDTGDRISTITDALGGVCQFTYDTTFTQRVAQIQAPDGRSAKFRYTASGMLWEIEDAQGIVSQLTYGDTANPDRVTALETPYGLTSFAYGESGAESPTRYRWIETTDPLGHRERVEFNERDDSGIPEYEPWNTDSLPRMCIRNISLYRRNTFVWSKKAFGLAPTLNGSSPSSPVDTPALGIADYAQAEVLHWLHTNDFESVQDTLESRKRPGESRVWFNYPGQDLSQELWTDAYAGGVPAGRMTSYVPATADVFVPMDYPVFCDNATTLGSPAMRSPSRIGRVVPDPEGTTNQDGSPVLVSQIEAYAYNDFGRITRYQDADGRETRYIYAANGIDLERVEQLTLKVANNPDPDSWTWTTLLSIDWNSGVPHRPHSVTDAAVETTTYTYNAAGQVRTVTNALNQTTTFWYHPTGQNLEPTDTLDANAVGFLVRIDGALAGSDDVVNFTWDAKGRLHTRRGPDGYTLTFSYDNLDRPTRVTYPDATYEELGYGGKLDVESYRDRAGRITSITRDALRHVRVVTDPAERVTEYTWCGCGSLAKIIDPEGHTQRFDYDTNGRLIDLYRDGLTPSDPVETCTFAYDMAGRLASRTDARNQTTTYRYTLAGLPRAQLHANAVETTPDTYYTFDPYFRRLTQVQDKNGTTVASQLDYEYYPITTTPGTLGAGQLRYVTGPVANKRRQFTYDALGRTLSRGVGTDYTDDWTYDELGRVDSTKHWTTTFTVAYVGATSRVDEISRPNGLKTKLTYDTLERDFAPLSTVTTFPSLAVLYSYSNVRGLLTGLVTSTSETISDGRVFNWEYRYNRADELETALRTGSVGPTGQSADFTYGSDRSGNLSSIQAGSSVRQWTLDARNRYVTESAGGKARILAQFNASPAYGRAQIGDAVVTVDGATNRAEHIVSVSAGANTIPITAVDATSGAVYTNAASLTVPDFAPKAYAYDANGNLTSVTQSGTVLRFYRWDARDRLVAWGSGTTVEGGFTYDGMGNRYRWTNATGGTIKSWVVDGGDVLEKLDSTASVESIYFAQGIENRSAGQSFYYAVRDLAGNQRYYMDASNALSAGYTYEPYGERLKFAGGSNFDLGFHGAYHHTTTGLVLAPEGKAYDPALGRWISPVSGSLNGYAFGGNAPPTIGDPFGLLATGAYPPTTDGDLLEATGLAPALGAFAAEVLIRGYSRDKGRRNDGSGACALPSRSNGGDGEIGPRNGAAKTVTSEGAADAANLAKLKDYYRQIEKYGADGVKELENGRIRFYDTLTPASNPGEMAGARLVREWDPATGATRTWYETVDQAGTVRSVAPKPATNAQNHLIFDANGNYVGRR